MSCFVLQKDAKKISMALSGTKILEKLKDAQIKWIHHLIFWLTFLCLLLIIEGFQFGFWNTLFYEFVNISFYAIIVYANLHYFIPIYLKKNKFAHYFLKLGLFIIILTPLKLISLYFLLSSNPSEVAQLKDNQGLILLSSFFVGGFSTMYNIVTEWATQIQEKQDLETQNMQSELKFLRSQINPHFLFNTLNNLYALTLKKSDQAPEIVIKLSEMMRYMLYECNEPKVLMSKELNYIKNYLDLERIRQNKVEIKFTQTGAVHTQKIAPLLLITFIENCFKHGIKNSLEIGYVNLEILIDENEMQFEVTNSKPTTLPYQEHKRSGGIGLVNVKRRLDLLYPNKHHLEIEDTPNTYSVRLNLNTQ